MREWTAFQKQGQEYNSHVSPQSRSAKLAAFCDGSNKMLEASDAMAVSTTKPSGLGILNVLDIINYHGPAHTTT